MSFKAKQRAKHGHLFGDGKYPLNAALVSSTDDPLFAPTKSSQSTRTSSPVKVDPLLRSDIDSSSSTPLFSRRTKADSIFGDIDVSKLGKRSPNSLKSNKPLEEDEDLFGGARRAPKKPPSIESNGNSMQKQQPVKITTTTTTKPLVQPSSPIKVSTNPSSPAKTPTLPTPIKPSVEDTKSSSFFASASRFFKSSSSAKPSASTSTSSSVSSDIQNQSISPSVTLPSSPPVDKTVVSVQQQQQTEPPQLQVVNRQVEEEEENDTNDTTPVIEDEATRAFADETISFSTRTINYTTSLTPDLLIDGIDLLKVRTPLSPSVSSPTHTTTTTAGGAELDPWALSISLEPSVSSPITRVPVQEIEPQKRRVFADLITSWNTGQIHREREEVDPDQFFHHVAEEQRDVGFAGISSDSPIKTIPTSVNIWEEVENPWS